nr:DUF3265 domain-containing protein [Vibrio owensii]
MFCSFTVTYWWVVINITNCSRVIRHAWHFYYALILVVKVLCGSLGIACLTP